MNAANVLPIPKPDNRFAEIIRDWYRVARAKDECPEHRASVLYLLALHRYAHAFLHETYGKGGPVAAVHYVFADGTEVTFSIRREYQAFVVSGL